MTDSRDFAAFLGPVGTINVEDDLYGETFVYGSVNPFEHYYECGCITDDEGAVLHLCAEHVEVA